MADFCYDTKCRRCNTIESWYFGSSNTLNWTLFATAMVDRIANPRLHKCKTCGFSTVQDVVSYTDVDGSDSKSARPNPPTPPPDRAIVPGRQPIPPPID